MIRAFLLLLGGAVAVLVALKIVSMVLVRRWTETLEFRGPVRGVEIVLGRGEVIVRGNDRSGARVRRRLRHGLRQPKISEQVDDGLLRLEVPWGFVQYEVDVPAGASVLVRGEHASATVVAMSGTVELRAASGSLEGRALSGGHVSATTAVGSIRLSFDRAPDVVDVTTRDGSVDLVLPEGPYEVDAGESEDATVGVRCAVGARSRVRARSWHGPVRIAHR